MSEKLSVEDYTNMINAKFPKDKHMTVDEVSEVVGPEFKEMNENPPKEVTDLRDEMQGKVAKFPKGVSMTVDEVAEVVGPEFKEMNENPPKEVTDLRDEMQGKVAAAPGKTQATILAYMEDAKKAALTDMARHPMFRGVPFQDIERSAEVLAKKGLITLSDDPSRGTLLRMAAGGLYGHTKQTQSDVEASVRKAQKKALQIAKVAYRKDERVAAFLQTHAKRANSDTAKILVSALKQVGPRVASDNQTASVVELDKAALAFRKIRELLKHETGHATLAFVKALDKEPSHYLGREFNHLMVQLFTMEEEIGEDSPIAKRIQKLWLDFMDYRSASQLEAKKGVQIKVNDKVVVGVKNGKFYVIVQGMMTTFDSKTRFIYALKNEFKIPSHEVEDLVSRLVVGKTAKVVDAGFGLYGHSAKVASLGLAACAEIRSEVGKVAYDLHSRRKAQYGNITGFLKEHSKTARCGYSRMLLSAYPDYTPESPKTASSVEDWLSWDE